MPSVAASNKAWLLSATVQRSRELSQSLGPLCWKRLRNVYSCEKTHPYSGMSKMLCSSWTLPVGSSSWAKQWLQEVADLFAALHTELLLIREEPRQVCQSPCRSPWCPACPAAQGEPELCLTHGISSQWGLREDSPLTLPSFARRSSSWRFRVWSHWPPTALCTAPWKWKVVRNCRLTRLKHQSQRESCFSCHLRRASLCD